MFMHPSLHVTPQPSAFARARGTIERLMAQPDLSLDALAASAQISPAHLQREFKQLTGLSPKRFSQMLSKQKLLAVLRAGEPVLQASIFANLSSTSRAHELILTAEGMTPAQVRGAGAGVVVQTATVSTDLGMVFAAWTGQGFCALEFVDGPQALVDAERRLVHLWPRARIEPEVESVAAMALGLLSGDRRAVAHVRASHFQLRVWQALMQLPSGRLVSYGRIAEALGLPNAARAVGRAVGSNPVALVIPCHRVIRESGALSGYRWDARRKALLIALEQQGSED